MDPVQKAVISHTFGVPSPLKKKLFISCNICHLRFNSAVRGSSGNRLGRGLGRGRAGDGISGVLPGGMGVAKGLWSIFSIPGCRRGTPGPLSIHPLLSSVSSVPSFSSTPGTPFPSPVPLSGVLGPSKIQEKRLPFLPHSGSHGSPHQLLGLEPILKHLRANRVSPCSSS